MHITVHSLQEIRSKATMASNVNQLYLLGVPDSLVVGKVHELVDEIGLVEVVGDRAQLAVRRQTLAVGCLAESTCFEHLRTAVNLRRLLLAYRETCQICKTRSVA